MGADKKNYFETSFKFFLALFLCLLVRLIPFRAPNVEPILATLMPLSLAYGAMVSFSFAVLSIFLYDTITHTLGVQTFFTVFAYGTIGLGSAYYFKNFKKNKASTWSYVRFAIWGTLFFDVFTGLLVGPIFFHQSFFVSFAGQIPFTLLHLIGNIIFAIILSPVIFNFLIKKKEKEIISTMSMLNPKTT